MRKNIVISKMHFFLLLMFFICNCGHSENLEEKGVLGEVKNQSFELSAEKLLNSDDPYKAGEWWRAIRDTMNFSNPNEIKKWLELQKAILMCPSNNLATVKRSAIQEFSFYIDYAFTYENWLKECKAKGYFKDRFIVQRLDMTLKYLTIEKERGKGR